VSAACAVYSNVIARKIVVAGLRAEPLRTAAHNYDRDKPVDRDFIDAVTDAARRYEQTPHNGTNNNNNKKRHQRVHEVQETDDAEDNEPTEASAVRAGANGSKLSAAKRSANKNKVCGYCKAKFHTEQECNKKKRALAERKALSVSADPAQAYAHAVESGNSLGRW
jgi:hypothetical protein